MKKQTQAIHLEYERRDAYDSLSVPVYNTPCLRIRQCCRHGRSIHRQDQGT